MINKHKKQKIIYQLIIDNKICLSFNTAKKKTISNKKIK